MTKKSIYSNKYRLLIQKLRKARLEASLTQKEVAKTLGRTQSYISKIEAGQLRVDIIQLDNQIQQVQQPKKVILLPFHV